MLDRLAVMLDEARDGAARVSTIVRELRSFSRADGETRHHVDLAAAQAILEWSFERGDNGPPRVACDHSTFWYVIVICSVGRPPCGTWR